MSVDIIERIAADLDLRRRTWNGDSTEELSLLHADLATANQHIAQLLALLAAEQRRYHAADRGFWRAVEAAQAAEAWARRWKRAAKRYRRWRRGSQHALAGLMQQVVVEHALLVEMLPWLPPVLEQQVRALLVPASAEARHDHA